MGCGPSKSGGGGDPLLTAEQRHNKGHHMAAAEQANQSGTSTPYYNRAKDRVDAIAESQTVTVGNNTQLTYAYVSQRGFYPDEPFKANQDAYCVHLPLLTSSTDNKESNADSSTTKDDAFFAVFDGHGKDGDGCAIFAKHDLPVQLQQELLENVVSTNNSPANSKSHRKIQNALKRAHLTTNQNLRQEVTVDDSLSGTTAISIYFHGNKRITISNLGDSRAVLGQIEEKTDASTASTSRTMSTSNHSGNSNNGNSSRHNNNNNKQSSLSVKALPLSRDQTPYRKDERNRIRATGARVLSLDQLEGLEPIEASENNEDSCDMLNLGEELDEGGDPPRVWHPIDDYPGTAFTRSIGDALAEELGVFAQPEMLTREIQPHDKILVLASDGVYEFLTNQSVIDICAKFQDPKEACHAVVAEAYELWLQYELRTDDITIICIFIDHIETDEEDKEEDTSTTKTTAPSAPASKRMLDSSIIETVDNMSLMAEGLRPVRKNVSKEKSKAIEKLKLQGKSMRIDVAAATEETVDLKQLATPKTTQEISAISEAIKASVMFRNVNHEQRQLIYSCMESIQVKAGTWVIRQGTVGDRFYIVDNGQFEVRIIPDGEEDPTGEGGHVIHQYEGSRERHAHPSFGELALMHSAPRSASIIAKTDGQLWALHRAAFRQILIQAQDHRKDLKKVLKKIPYFQNLDSDGINKLAAIHEDITFGRGDNITEQGQPGEKMFVVESGSAYCTQISGGETKRTTIKAGSYFGDEIFDNDNKKYKQTIVAMQTTTCWQLDATLLQQTMGPLLLARGSD